MSFRKVRFFKTAIVGVIFGVCFVVIAEQTNWLTALAIMGLFFANDIEKHFHD